MLVWSFPLTAGAWRPANNVKNCRHGSERYQHLFHARQFSSPCHVVKEKAFFCSCQNLKNMALMCSMSVMEKLILPLGLCDGQDGNVDRHWWSKIIFQVFAFGNDILVESRHLSLTLQIDHQKGGRGRTRYLKKKKFLCCENKAVNVIICIFFFFKQMNSRDSE